MQRKEMELEGSLRSFTVPDILQFLANAKMTGTLSIWREEYHIDLVIREGKIVNSSALNRPRKLGDMLVYRGFLKRLELMEVLGAQKNLDRGRLLGQILLEREMINKNALRDVLKLQLEDEIWELFSWQDGQFKFEHRKDIDTSNIVVEIDIEPLLIEGSRRQDEWARIIKSIPGNEVVFAIQNVPENFDNATKLPENEWMILSLINGIFNVGSIVDRSGLGKFETYRILNTFISSGMIKEKSPEKALREVMRDSAPTGVVSSLKNVLTQDSPATESMATVSASRKGFSSLFSRSKPTRERTSIQLEFISPLGAIAFFVNSFFETLITIEGFQRSGKQEDRMLCSLWKNTLMQFPKADIICISNGRINVKPLELIIQWENDISKAIHECFDDSYAALMQLTQIIYHIAVERLGDKMATRITAGLLQDFIANIKFKHAKSFELRSWIQEILKI
ncbi:DUF4388 domain-containing protein [Candidatus Sumerlaeota bacterium]|nr:DUF4388 domain-containing protein [Candidatus Sumerlaeota bacterium]